MEPFVVTSLLYCKEAWQLLDAFADSARGLMRLYDGQSVTISGVLDDALSHAFWVAGTKWGGNHETQEYELGNSNCARRRGGSRIFG
jgi:hypothetical protein